MNFLCRTECRASQAARCAFLVILGSACLAQERILWREPPPIERIDLRQPAGGPKNTPKPPFRFVSEDWGGTSPKVLVTDRAGVQWRVKGGLEVKSESFATRLVSAMGYHAEPTVFVASGRIEGVNKKLDRAKNFIRPDGSFTNAAFERRDPQLKYLDNHDWAWNQNPFSKSRQLQGLKILVMLLSNWDNKDRRNWIQGSNTGILERNVNGRREWIYFVNDWGQTLGAWGAELTSKNWDCARFSAQTPEFVKAENNDKVSFGFTGQHNSGFQNDITTADIRWLLQYLGRITDAQLRRGLQASGATSEETACFVKALRERITRLASVAKGDPQQSPSAARSQRP
jgi:hypothetical protein